MFSCNNINELGKKTYQRRILYHFLDLDFATSSFSAGF